MNDRSVIDAFVAHLREEGYPDLRVERRPDDENRESSDIDAITGPFAIEHTSIDTLPNPYRRQLTGPLQRGQTQTIAPVGLDPIAGPPGDQRRRHHRAIVPQSR